MLQMISSRKCYHTFLTVPVNIFFDGSDDLYLYATIFTYLLICTEIVFSFFQKGISESTSVMKIPESVNRSSTDIVDVVQWTAGLDTLFKRIRQEDPKIRWGLFIIYIIFLVL